MRLVAKEIKRDKRDDLFAATPPLEAKKMLFSMAVTEGVGAPVKDKKLDFIDVRRAYFHARARREMYVELPEEDAEFLKTLIETVLQEILKTASGQFITFDVNYAFGCAIDVDGALHCWGANPSGQASPPSGSYNQVSTGDYHACALGTDKSVRCWGNNDHGQTQMRH